MSYLADSVYAFRNAKIQRKNLDKRIPDEIIEAKRIQAETGCTWDDALRIARKHVE